jgi:hypothetical protein
MAPLKNPTNFKFCLFFYGSGSVATLVSTLGCLESTTISIDVVEVVIIVIPLVVGPQVQILIFGTNTNELGFDPLVIQPSKKWNASCQLQKNFKTLGMPSSHGLNLS